MEIFVNRAWATLAADLTALATTMTLTAGHGARFGTIGAGERIRIDLINSARIVTETVYMTGLSGDVATIERAADGTGAVEHLAANTRIEARIGKSTFAQFAPMAGSATQVFSVAAATAAAHAVRSEQVSADNSKFPIYSEPAGDTYTFTDVSGAGLAITSNFGTWRRVGKLFSITGQVTYPTTADTSIAGISCPFPWKGYNIGVVVSNYANPIVAIGNTGGSSICFDTQVGVMQVNNANLSGKTIYFTLTGSLL